MSAGTADQFSPARSETHRSNASGVLRSCNSIVNSPGKSLQDRWAASVNGSVPD